MKSLSKVIIASTVGLVTGAALGILFAPKKGKKTRKGISKKTKKFVQKMDEAGKEKLAELKKGFDDQIEKVNEKIKSFVN